MAMIPRMRWKCFGHVLPCALVMTMMVRLSRGHLYKVCLVQNPGFAECSLDPDKGTYMGLDVDVITMVADSLGWHKVPANTDPSTLTSPSYGFVCTNQRVGGVIDQLVANGSLANATCMLGAGAFTVTAARVQMGAQFAWTHLHSSLGVMVKNTAGEGPLSKWAFMRPFSLSVWIAVVINTIVTPVLLSVFENLIQTGHLPVGMSLLDEWRHAIYTMFLCCFNLNVLKVLSFPCQIIIICFAFANLILVASYTAQLAAALTIQSVDNGISNLAELAGKRILSHSVYVDALLRNSDIKAAPVIWEGHSTFVKARDMLIGGDIDAFIFDKPILQYYLNELDPDCLVKLLADDTLEPFDLSVCMVYIGGGAREMHDVTMGGVQAAEEQGVGVLSTFGEVRNSGVLVGSGSAVRRKPQQRVSFNKLVPWQIMGAAESGLGAGGDGSGAQSVVAANRKARRKGLGKAVDIAVAAKQLANKVLAPPIEAHQIATDTTGSTRSTGLIRTTENETFITQHSKNIKSFTETQQLTDSRKRTSSTMTPVMVPAAAAAAITQLVQALQAEGWALGATPNLATGGSSHLAPSSPVLQPVPSNTSPTVWHENPLMGLRRQGVIIHRGSGGPGDGVGGGVDGDVVGGVVGRIATHEQGVPDY